MTKVLTSHRKLMIEIIIGTSKFINKLDNFCKTKTKQCIMTWMICLRYLSHAKTFKKCLTLAIIKNGQKRWKLVSN